MQFVWLKFLLSIIPTAIFIAVIAVFITTTNLIILIAGLVLVLVIMALEIPLRHLARMGIIHNLVYYYKNNETWHNSPLQLAKDEIKKQGFGIIALFFLDRAISRIVTRVLDFLPNIPFLKSVAYASKKYLDECIVFYAVFTATNENLGAKAFKALLVYFNNYHKILWQSFKYVVIGIFFDIVFLIFAIAVLIFAIYSQNWVVIGMSAILLATLRAFKVAYLNTKLFLDYLVVYKSFLHQTTSNINIDISRIPGINKLKSL